MAFTFQGIDPSTAGRTGLQAKQYLEGVFGSPLSQQQIGQAGQYLSTLGYTDQTGAAAMSGAQWNQLMQEAARQSGGAFNAWAAPATAPTRTPLQFEVPDAPTYTPPTYEAPDPYEAPSPFEYEAYTPTTATDLEADPSYQWRFDQGAKALQASAAAGGYVRTGGSMADLLKYGQDYASTEFGNVDARRRADYSLGYGTAADMYDRNTSEGRYAHEQATDAAQRTFENATSTSQAEYAPRLLSWQEQNAASQREAELNFDREWQRELYERDDTYRRERATAEDAWRQFQYTGDDAWRRYALQIESELQVAAMGRF